MGALCQVSRDLLKQTSAPPLHCNLNRFKKLKQQLVCKLNHNELVEFMQSFCQVNCDDLSVPQSVDNNNVLAD